MSRLHLEADLWIDVEGRPFHLTAQGQSLVLEVMTLRPFLRAGASRRHLASIAELLAAQEVSLKVVAQGMTLLRLGHGVASRWGERMLGSPNIHIHHLPRLLALLLRR